MAEILLNKKQTAPHLFPVEVEDSPFIAAAVPTHPRRRLWDGFKPRYAFRFLYRRSSRSTINDRGGEYFVENSRRAGKLRYLHPHRFDVFLLISVYKLEVSGQLHYSTGVRWSCHVSCVGLLTVWQVDRLVSATWLVNGVFHFRQVSTCPCTY